MPAVVKVQAAVIVINEVPTFTEEFEPNIQFPPTDHVEVPRLILLVPVFHVPLVNEVQVTAEAPIFRVKVAPALVVPNWKAAHEILYPCVLKVPVVATLPRIAIFPGHEIAPPN